MISPKRMQKAGATHSIKGRFPVLSQRGETTNKMVLVQIWRLMYSYKYRLGGRGGWWV